MKKNILSSYESADRMAEVFKDDYHYGVDMYERETKAWGYGHWVLRRTELLKNCTERYADDLAENYVEKWGAFKDGD